MEKLHAYSYQTEWTGGKKKESHLSLSMVIANNRCGHCACLTAYPTMINHEQHPSFAAAEVRQKHETLTGISAVAKAISRAG